jgi:hypothetical protein
MGVPARAIVALFESELNVVASWQPNWNRHTVRGLAVSPAFHRQLLTDYADAIVRARSETAIAALAIL